MMNRPSLALLLVLLVASRPSHAQEREYQPAYRLPNGREIVAVYFGASNCGPCLFPEVKTAVKSMKNLLEAQAHKVNASFAVIGVANDWELTKATGFLESVGPFDQLVLGGNWTNIAIERFIWRDSTGSPMMPQVLVFERTVTPGERVVFSEPRLLRRVSSSGEIRDWVAAGAPIAITDSRHP